MGVRRSKALLTNTLIVVLCFLIKFMRDRKDSRNLPFYIRSEILRKSKRDVVRNENFSEAQRIKEETTLEIKS